MKITLTGSLGRIGKALAVSLIHKGHEISIISNNADKKTEIESLGAKAAIGSIEDLQFLVAAFTGADMVYLMEPPFNYFDKEHDIDEYYLNIGRNYCEAICQAQVSKIIHLSSIGAHTDKGVGMLSTHHHIEVMLNQLPASVIIKTMRPVGFYYNMYAFIPSIKNAGAIIQNYGGDEKEPWVSPLDIAEVISEETEKPFIKREVRYIASDEASPNEVATILGEAIGNNSLKWQAISNEQFEANLINIGFNPKAAKGFTEMNAARVNGILYEDYYKHRPTHGKVKLATFAKDFAKAYANSK